MLKKLLRKFGFIKAKPLKNPGGRPKNEITADEIMEDKKTGLSQSTNRQKMEYLRRNGAVPAQKLTRWPGRGRLTTKQREGERCNSLHFRSGGSFVRGNEERPGRCDLLRQLPSPRGTTRGKNDGLRDHPNCKIKRRRPH